MGPDIRVGSTGDFSLRVDHLVSHPVEVLTTHVALRGTYLPGTVRCTSGHRMRWPSYSDAWSSGLLIYCFADVRVNAYLLGTGPSTLTVTVYTSLYQSVLAFGGDDEDYGLEQLESRRLAYERALSEGGRFQYDPPLRGFLPPDGGLGLLRREYDTLDEAHEPNGPAVIGPPGGIGGREAVLFIGPSYRASVEAWMVFWTWDVERREDGTVVAIHPFRDRFDIEAHRSLLEMELPALTRAVTTAHQARVAANGGRIGEDTDLPMLETDANRLRQYFSDPKVGGYAPGVPAPAPPPPPCGLAVQDQGDNPGLMRDCMALLAAKDTACRYRHVGLGRRLGHHRLGRRHRRGYPQSRYKTAAIERKPFWEYPGGAWGPFRVDPSQPEFELSDRGDTEGTGRSVEPPGNQAFRQLADGLHTGAPERGAHERPGFAQSALLSACAGRPYRRHGC